MTFTSSFVKTTITKIAARNLADSNFSTINNTMVGLKLATFFFKEGIKLYPPSKTERQTEYYFQDKNYLMSFSSVISSYQISPRSVEYFGVKAYQA